MTISKTKLLEWVRQQRAIDKERNITWRVDCWNLLTEAIEKGEFDE